MSRLHEPLPENRGLWTLSRMRKHCPALSHLRTDGGVSRRLKKWAIRRKRGRLHLLSPDPEFATKQQAIAAILSEANQSPGAPGTLSVLFGDEFTFYRQPFLGRTWTHRSSKQPTTSHRGGPNTKRRVVGALDAVTGRVHSYSAEKMGNKGLKRFLGQLRQALGEERRIVLIWDNWPVHKNDEVTAAARAHRIELLHTPTYAPWCNPIEKFWHKFKREVLVMHRLHEEWTTLRSQAEAFLQEHDCPRSDVLRLVGLTRQEGRAAKCPLLAAE